MKARGYPSCFWHAFVIVLILVACAGLGGESWASTASKEPAFFPIPSTPQSGVSDMVVEPGGPVWIMSNNKIFYWSGSEFSEPVTGPMPSGTRFSGLYGGEDRGAYAMQRGDGEHEGLLYRLSDGGAHLVTSFYYEVSHEKPGLYVSRSGMVFNWGHRFLAHLTTDGWERAEVRLGLPRDTCVFDLGEHVYFYYDNNLCRGGNDGIKVMEPPQWHKARPGQNRSVGVRWGETRALLVNYGEQAGIFAFDLETCNEVPLDDARTALGTTRVFDAFSLPDGSVWLMVFPQGERAYTFIKLGTDGKVEPVLSTGEVPWDNSRCWLFPESVLVTSNGAIVFGLPQDGIAIWQNDKVRRYGWREGFATGVLHLHEDHRGNLWAPVGDQVARFRLDGESIPALPAFADWTEHLLVSGSRIWELEPGLLAMFRAETPKQLSRWDGSNWSLQTLPFDRSKIGRSMVDDCGHLLIAMSAFPDGVFDVGPQEVKRFEGMPALLAAAVRRGAKKFQQYDGYQGVVVESPDRIWYGYHNSNTVILIEGDRTDEISFTEDVSYIYPSDAYGMLVLTEDGRYYRYDRGQMVEVPQSPGNEKLKLLGYNGFQPYEPTLVADAQPYHYPVLWDGSERRLYFSVKDAEAAAEGICSNAPFVVLSRYVEQLYPSARGGAWLEYFQGAGGPARIIANRRFDLDFSKTPIAGSLIRRAREDRVGNLWVESAPYAGTVHAFVYELGKVRLTHEPLPPVCGRTLSFGAKVLPERYESQANPLVRVSPSDWVPAGSDGLQFTVRFPESGTYTVEVGALIMGSLLQSTPAFTLQATVALPNTIRTDASEGSILLDDPFWEPPIAGEKTVEGARLSLQWRVNGQEWQNLFTDSSCYLADLKPGSHVIDFAAEEDEFWTDPSPLSIPICYAPDYVKAVDRRVSDLLDSNPERQERASRELVQLGKIAPDVVERRLEAAEAEAKLVPLLRQILRQR